MSSEEIAIKVDNVSKNFILPHEKVNSVKGLFTSATKRKAKKSSEIQHALKDISFEVKKGEFFGIVGRNGSGKSTLLKILAGIYQPSSGAIQTHGKLVPFIELGVGFNPELTGRENVYLNGALLGFSDKEIDIMYEDIVAFAELERFMDQKLKNYSSGMQVRLAFSMATRSEADILLIDEVLAVGDAAFQRKCFEYFKSLKKDKKTVVFVSHDMDAVRKYCDRAAFIEDSELISSGNPNDIATLYSKMFFDAPSESKTNSPAKRWGKAKVLSGLSVQPKKITAQAKHIIVEVNINPNTKLDNPAIGFSIKNSSGLIITGTNTKLKNIESGVIDEGSNLKFVFEIQNIFADGNYYVDAAVVGNDGVEVIDWWESAVGFTVFEERPSNYVVSPGVKVSIIKVSR